MKKLIPLATFFILTVFFFAPSPTNAQNTDGCSSVGGVCSNSGGYSGTCAQNDVGGFYCRPDALSQPVTTSGSSGFTALAPIPGLTDAANTSAVNANSLANFFNNLYKYLIGLAATLAVIMIIWGGLEISTKDSVSKQSDGKERIYQAIIGLVLVLSPVLVFSIINPAILNLSINLPPLDTASGPRPSINTGTPNDPVIGAAIAAGCSEPITGLAGIQSTICPQQKDAQAFADSCNQQPGGVGQVTEVPLSSPVQYRATCNKPLSTGGTCNVTGTAGILQIASCPTKDAATTWGQQNCTDGNLSNANTVNPANGVLMNIAVCAGKQYYIFIDPTSLTTFVINTIRPVARTTNSPPDRPNNGSDAMAFKNICQGVGLELQTCVSDDPFYASATPCNLPAGPSSNTSWKCYRETLSCENSLTAPLSRKCSKNPSWTPF